MKIVKILVIFFLLLFSFLFYSFSIERVFSEETEEEITLVIPEVKTISISSPRRIAISNPEIADISSVSQTELIVSPKAVGKTTLIVWDAAGRKTTYPIRVLSEDLSEIKMRIDKLIAELGYPDIYSKISKEENKILLLGNVDSQEHKEKLDSVLLHLKEKIIDMIEVKAQSQLVQIDVEVLEISKNALEDLGFKWVSTIDDSSSSGIKWTEQGWDESGGFKQDIYKLFRLSRIWDRGAISAQLNLIISQGKGRVLSRPKLVCLSGKEASFLVGGEIPVVTSTSVSGGISVNVEYKDYGILLEISPTVKSENFIQAVLNTEVSGIDEAKSVTVSGMYVPAFSKRTAKTELFLKEGQAVFLAGLISSEDSKNINKLPALANIPILGALFRSRKFQEDETELVISLTPKIIRQREEVSTKELSSSLKKEYPRTLVKYIQEIQRRIGNAVFYPESVRRYDAEGEVLLSLHILADGRLLNVVVNKSSGNKMLDEASINIVKAQAPFPPLPRASGLSEIWIDVPIVFRSN
jgi:TonB family protein